MIFDDIDDTDDTDDDIPSGKRLHNYGKSKFIVDFPMNNGDFPFRYLNVYQRVSWQIGSACWRRRSSSCRLHGTAAELVDSLPRHPAETDLADATAAATRGFLWQNARLTVLL